MTAESPSSNASVPRRDSRAPVGIFDSGLGGLSVLRAVRAQLPDEALIYVADSLYAPYGERDDDFIADRTLAIGEWLVAQGAKALVVACNTATAQSIALVREKLPIPLIGVEPGVKPAALQSKTRVAGVLATARDLAQRPLSGAARALRRRLPLSLPAGPRARAGRRTLRHRLAPNCARCCASYLQPMLDAGADTLVLGCTHYPFLDAAIRDIVGDRLHADRHERRHRAPTGARSSTSTACARRRTARHRSAPFLFDQRRHASAAARRDPAAVSTRRSSTS